MTGGIGNGVSTESGSPSLCASSSGTDGLAAGGGGGARPQSSAGGTEPGADGGNGVVIIRYKSAFGPLQLVGQPLQVIRWWRHLPSSLDLAVSSGVHLSCILEKNVTQGTSAIEYDGTGDYLNVPYTTDFDWQFCWSKFTIEGWAKIQLQTMRYYIR